MQKKFKGTIQKLSDPGSANLGWRIVDIPFDVKKAFGKGGTVPVTGTVNGFGFRTSVFPRKSGPHFLPINKAMQRGSGATALGDAIQVAIDIDAEKRTVVIPPLLKSILSEEEGLLTYYSGFSYSMRKYFADHVTQPKSDATRHKRAEQLAIILMEMRDGEAHPPPILEAEFARNPKARNGWERMTASQRRSHLWGIFYYRNLESRARRMSKAIEAMVERSKTEDRAPANPKNSPRNPSKF
jgi:uncharacterized protein YdeI (YjbR/CyaY-like superfamily)